jgi:tRNA modification GTPase
MYNDFDTIFAVASGAGRAAVTLLRISGARAGAVLDQLCARPPARMASLRTLRGTDGAVLDHALVLWLPGPGSYTGEDSVELNLHGGRAVLSAVADTLVHLGARPAEAGEFTRRAFLNGRMDLVEAEAVADLIESETTAQRAQALRQMDGALGEVLHDWASRLTRLLAQQEALIDFPDEDLPPEVEALMLGDVAGLLGEVSVMLNDGRRGEKLREGLVFAVVGPPNAGKSTLVNALAAREVAIVSESPGTTRDVLEVRLDLGGVPVTLLDTAGLREAGDAIEAEGIRRARARMADADFVVQVADDGAFEALHVAEILRVHTKADIEPREGLSVSAATGLGMDTLRNALASAARQLTHREGPPPLTRARHRAALSDAAERLEAALAAQLPELRGEDLRMALRAIGRITGAVGVEDILDQVFRQFCIGK